MPITPEQHAARMTALRAHAAANGWLRLTIEGKARLLRCNGMRGDMVLFNEHRDADTGDELKAVFREVDARHVAGSDQWARVTAPETDVPDRTRDLLVKLDALVVELRTQVIALGRRVRDLEDAARQ